MIKFFVVQLVKQLLPEIDKNKLGAHKVHLVELTHYSQDAICKLQSSHL